MNLAELPKEARERIAAERAAYFILEHHKSESDRDYFDRLRGRLDKFKPEFRRQVLEALKEIDPNGR